MASKGNPTEKQVALDGYIEKVVASPLPGVNLLVLGRKSTIVNGLRQLDNYLSRQHGIAGNFLINGIMPDAILQADSIADVDQRVLSGEFTLAFGNDLKKDIFKEYYKKKETYNETRAKIFGDLLIALDKPGQELVKNHPDFNGLAKNNPLGLWKLIDNVYSHGYHGLANPVEKKHKARFDYDHCYMGDKMSLVEFKQVFMAARDNLTASGHTQVPTDQDLAEEFLFRVNKSRYAAVVQNIRNTIGTGGANFPATIDDCITRIETAIAIDSKAYGYVRERRPTAFVANDANYNRSNPNNVRNNTIRNNTNNTNANSNGDSSDADTNITCYKCKEIGHKANKCPNKKKINGINNANNGPKPTAKFGFAFNVMSKVNLSVDKVIWDTGCTTHICNDPDRCQDVHMVNDSIEGISGEVSVSLRGVMPVFGGAMIIPDAPASLVSASLIERSFQVSYESLKAYTVHLGNGNTIRFEYDKHTGLYVCDLSDLTQVSYVMFNVNTVTANRRGFTNAQLKRADGVKELIRRFSFASYNDLIQVIHNGGIINCPFTSEDVMNCYQIYGNDNNYLKGTMIQGGVPAIPGVIIRMENIIRTPADLVVDAQDINVDKWIANNPADLVVDAQDINVDDNNVLSAVGQTIPVIPTPEEVVLLMNGLGNQDESEFATKTKGSKKNRRYMASDSPEDGFVADERAAHAYKVIDEIIDKLYSAQPAREVDANRYAVLSDEYGSDASEETPDGNPTSTVNVDAEPVVGEHELVRGDISEVAMYCFAQMSLSKALSLHNQMTIAGMKKELKQMIDKNVFKFVNRSEIASGVDIIPCHMVCKDKIDGDVVLEIRARLVAGGNWQVEKEHENLYSSTVKTTSVFILLADAAAKRLFVKAIDIEGAYLEADMTEVVYVRISKNIADVLAEMYPNLMVYQDASGCMYVQLIKALYGTIQGMAKWQEKLSAEMGILGYEQCPDDDCVYTKMVNGSLMKIAAHVDDLLGTHKNKTVLDSEMELIGKRFSGFKSSNDNDPIVYLGMKISRNVEMDVMVSMKDYINKICSQHGVTKVSSLPASKDLFDRDTSHLLDDTKKAEYHNAVAQCLYIAKRVRPDILLSASYLCSKVNAPTVKNMVQVMKVLSYLYGTKNRGIVYKGGADLNPHVFGDAAFLVHEDLRSRGGSIAMVAGGPVECHSSKQTILTKSSTEAELVNLDDAVCCALHLKRLLNNIKEEFMCIPVLQDNQSVLALVRRGKPASLRTKHISLRYFSVCEHVNEGVIELLWCSTADMLADIMTKPLDGNTFKKFRDILVPIIGEIYL
jgi:hypothetical protein